MKRKLFLLTLGIAFTMLVTQLNRVDVYAITQDEMVEMMKQSCQEMGIDFDDCKTTGGTAGDVGNQEAIKKAEEFQKQNNESLFDK